MPTLEMMSTRVDPTSVPSGTVEGLYVHVPFCFHKCHYCDFYSITRQTPERMDRFVDLILREADLWRVEKAPVVRPRTVFFGGGTPSLLPIEPMRRLIAGLRDRFDFSECVEWTIEANPATLTADYCQMLAGMDINRISMGAQSFDPKELAILERHHEPDDVPRGLELARKAGIHRLNVDLIFAIPGQSLTQWMKSLESAIALQTDHLSCYALTFELNTPIAVRRRLGQIQSIASELELEMLLATRKRLGAEGLAAYEISNFARRGEECLHNLMYWRGGNYLGLGPSAASHIRGWRWRNRPHLGEWESAVETNQLPACELEILSPLHRAGELAMLRLRLTSGIDFAEFEAQTGYDVRTVFSEVIERLGKPGLLDLSQTSIRLSERGIAVADAIASEFLAATTS